LHLDRSTCPALVVWGMKDPYLPGKFGRLYADRLPNSEFVPLDDAGHWPWIDAPGIVDKVTRFLQA
jgi:pimeloyl-ACP methyl ester carboxylesterase